MKKIWIFIFLFVFLQKTNSVFIQNKIKINKEWEALICALIEVESSGNSKAINTSGAVGILQIMPIYVKECNRIVGYEKWSLDDRYCRDKSIEMFETYQTHKNPKKCILKAIKLHNPKGSVKYMKKVLKMKKI